MVFRSKNLGKRVGMLIATGEFLLSGPVSRQICEKVDVDMYSYTEK